ncbi:hypothetical protein MOQ_004212 [Trypanosoma cruzi marinkellei]|uniref:Uncharacterized protein n=1 Tax=Trypanosoma cruzi marinkellei TaxID=85056 RepID=K2NAP4_TRYCR|nr:hypothetical protein MOQ_004212 [Trypanosoma cruzi marinkellei]
MLPMKFARAHLRRLHVQQSTSTFAIECSLPFLCAWRAMKHRSLAPDDPFGERSAYSDPSDGLFAAWSGVDFDAFANAASSEEVRTAHFGPEWSRFATVGRLSVKIMNEQGTPGAASAVSSKDGNEAMPRPLTAEELHSRELQARRKALEGNYATYEQYVMKELGIEDGGNEDDDVEEEMDDATELENASEDTMRLPHFMLERGGRQVHADDTKAQGSTCGKPLLRPREGLQVPEALMQMILDALGEPHGDPHLPRSDPLHWNTEGVILWVRKMEAARFALMSAAETGEASLLETPLMEDPSMHEAFRMARTNGEFLLHHTVPNTMFQVMRRWYLRRQEIALTIMKEWQDMKNTTSITLDDVNDATFKSALEAGRGKLDEAAAKVTPTLIQETISQCYPYCH